MSTDRIVIRILAGICGTAVLAAIFYPVFPELPTPPDTACRSNLKQINTGMIIYSNDYDDLAPGRKWIDDLEPYTKNEALFTDVKLPPGSYGYSMNRRLVHANIKSSTDASFFDSERFYRNSVSGLESLPNPPRHNGLNNVVFADGHTKKLERAAS